MKLLRIDAALIVNASAVRDHRLCILCGVGDDRRVLSGPWYGHEYADKITYPFMIRKLDQILWGWAEHLEERTNLNTKTVQMGEQITLFGDSTGRNIEWAERVFRIIEITEVR
jgi:hypothetical protein